MNKLALLSALAYSVSLAACVIPMSTRGAEEAQMRQYQRMCGDANYAYESGNNDGMKRRPLDTQWVDMYCVPEYRQQVRTAYQSGYQLGIFVKECLVRRSSDVCQGFVAKGDLG